MTSRRTLAAVALGGVAVGGLAGRSFISRRRGKHELGGQRDSAPRWHAVTIYRPLDEIAPQGRLPEPLAALGDEVEIDLRPAPGGRGTEVYARLRDGEPSGIGAIVAKFGDGGDPRQRVRTALREAKQLVETGEVLLPSGPPTTRKTLLSRPLEFATRHGRGEGLL